MQAELTEECGAFDLDDPEALDASVVGAKASHLAVARRAGLPVRRGIVLPVRASTGALRAATAVALEDGLAAARLRLSDEAVPESFVAKARDVFGSELLVARSSSPLEADGAWSGAFTSYIGIDAIELPVAVRGCWASMFGRDASERFEALGIAPSTPGMAVLVQACITPEPGGVALVDGDVVEVMIADGSLAAMLQGWDRGLSGVADGAGPPRGPAVERFGVELVEDVARIALAWASATGDDHLEWAQVDGDVVVLQGRRLAVAAGRPAGRARRADARLRSELAARAGRLIARYGGPSGDLFVLPWALAPATSASRHSAPPCAVIPASAERLQAGAERLIAAAWDNDASAATAEAAEMLAALKSRLDPAVLDRLGRLQSVDWAEGRRLIDGAESLGSWLVARGLMADPSDVWRLAPSDLADHLTLTPRLAQPEDRRPVPPDPWEAFLLECIRANGNFCNGQPASDGAGAGRVLRLDVPQRLPGSLQRYVLYLRAAEPGFAPLLWGAAGLIAAGGSASAHLFDVARSLGVPAVVGCELPERHDSGDLAAAVDGSSGAVALL